MIAVLGGGESGTGAAMLAKSKGLEVLVSDNGIIQEKFKKDLLQYGIRWEEGKHSEQEILHAEEVIKSPGIPDTVPMIRKIREQGISLISEIEFAGRFIPMNCGTKKICITGSNGKTTTTTLIHHIFQKAGCNVAIAGNIGKSLGRVLAESGDHRYDYIVMELSSFQLDHMYKFKADVAVISNITRNHLNRYDYDLQKYIDSKFRITQNQGPGDALIYNLDDEITGHEISKRKLGMRHYPFTLKQEVKEGAYKKESQLITIINKTQTTMFIHELALIGKHNYSNSMAATLATRIFDISNDVIRESLADIQPLEHRTEHVATVKGIDFINDSKSTTVDATWWALESMDHPVILIMGGEDKGNDYSQLTELAQSKVKALILLGKDNTKIYKAFKNSVLSIYETQSMVEAVHIGYRLGKKGEVVLLSPGCASFDLFNDYEDRGWQFKRAVRSL